MTFFLAFVVAMITSFLLSFNKNSVVKITARIVFFSIALLLFYQVYLAISYQYDDTL